MKVIIFEIKHKNDMSRKKVFSMVINEHKGCSNPGLTIVIFCCWGPSTNRSILGCAEMNSSALCPHKFLSIDRCVSVISDY